MSAKPTLFAFAGLPATGKSTIARALAQERGAAYLRIDVIEQALRSAGLFTGPKDDVGPAGYVIAYALAESNLRLGRSVVADSVNPIGITRDAWRQVAATAGALLAEIEVICSDPAEHRHRAETRRVDIAELQQPSWQQIVERAYDAWDRPHIVLDTAGRSIGDVLDELRGQL